MVVIILQKAADGLKPARPIRTAGRAAPGGRWEFPAYGSGQRQVIAMGRPQAHQARPTGFTSPRVITPGHTARPRRSADRRPKTSRA